MQITKIVFLVALYLVSFVSIAKAEESNWKLPIEINDKNTEVTFEVDSTWVLVEGKTSGISGKVFYSNPLDPTSITSEIHFPVVKFDTNSSMRDEHLRKVMAEKDFPEVIVKTQKAEGDCSPKVLQSKKQCLITQHGTMTIRDITREIKLVSKVSDDGNDYLVSSDFTFPWAAFGVEDPSKFFAKLKPDVTVRYSLKVQK